MQTESRQPEVLSQNTNETQLIHWKTCRLDYPLEVFAAAGETINNTIIICGGCYDQNDTDYTGNCYSFKEGWNNWRPHVNLTTARGYTASIAIGDMIWITGGYAGNKSLATTERVYLNKTIQPGPTLPQRLDSHCMADDENHIFILGGIQEWNKVTNDVLMYDKHNIFGGPNRTSPMIYGRKRHDCTIFFSQSYGRNVLLVAGGYGRGQKSAEILDFQLGLHASWKKSKFESSNLT